MVFEAELEIALHATAPSNQLRIFVEQLLRRGEPKEALLANLDTYRRKLLSSRRDRDGDLILEAMEHVRRWSPSSYPPIPPEP